MYHCLKNRQNRYTILSDRNLKILTEYWYRYDRPRGWLFPSTVRDALLTPDAVVLFVRDHARKLGLPEGVTPHTLRHYFACHSLEDGTSHTFIQRSCPMCQALSNGLWVDTQNGHVLDIDYYHLVFTCPGELNTLVYCNQKELYSLFFNAVAETVMELSRDPAHMGGTPGFISIMHTWGSNLSCHPHIHVLCTGGGLDAGRNWHQKKGGFFLPGKAMAALFKGKFLSGLKELHEAGKLCYEGKAAKYRNRYEYQELLDFCYGKNWVTDIRESFAGAETVMHYLGRYTHRIAIGNSRILRMDENTLTIKVKDYKSGGQWKDLTLDGVEFVRRFLMHVPPGGFVRIRHYGILSNQNKRKLIPICRNLIGCREFLGRFRKCDKAQAIRILYKKDVTVCPCCCGAISYEVCTEWASKRSST